MTTRKIYLAKVFAAFSLSLLVTLIIMSSALASGHSKIVQDQPYRVERFDIGTPGALEVETSGGHITVEGSATNSVRVEMYVNKNGRNLLQDDTALKKWEIDISQSGNTIKAIAKHRGTNWKIFGNNISISFVVYAPREMSTVLETSGGHIEVRGLDGNQKISTSGGHLDLANLKGTIRARTSGGHIDIADIQGEIDARTSGGHIDVQNSEGKLTLKTSGGHIDLDEVSGTVKASTSGGGISADLIAIGEFVDLKTSGGNVTISVPENIGLDLNLRGSYVKSSLKNFSGKIDRDEIDGKLNGGGPKINARTSGGIVSLSFKQ